MAASRDRRHTQERTAMAPADIASLADIVRVHGAATPEKTALEVGDRTVTFGELDTRSNQAAQAFRAAGVGFGDRVAYIEKNGTEFYEVTFGLSKLGAVSVAVNWRLAAPEMRQIIDDARAEVVVVGPDFFAAIESIEGDLERVHTIVAIGAHDRWPSLDDWIGGHPAEDPAVETTGDDIAFQLYTSGTTGLPKGVMLKNDNFFGAVTGIADQWRFTPDSVNLAMMPSFHIAGAGWGMIGLYFGCTNVVMRDIDPAAILKA
ncbi:MAG TPA: AMP-binding protein, partial [Iamia sp.]